jgi:hypothetical protein
MFKDSHFDVLGGLSMANLGFAEYNDCETDVNYVLLDDLPQWSREGEITLTWLTLLLAVPEKKLLHIPYDVVLNKLRPALLGLKKHTFR